MEWPTSRNGLSSSSASRFPGLSLRRHRGQASRASLIGEVVSLIDGFSGQLGAFESALANEHYDTTVGQFEGHELCSTRD
jgi:hypothetical protein